MKERPILFNGPMVRALLDGSKTQTRRIVMGQTPEWATVEVEDNIPGRELFAVRGAEEWPGISPLVDGVHCPYGQPSDRLWVRETWGVVSNDWDADGNLVDWTPDRPATAITEMRFGQGYYSGHAIYAADGSYEWAGDDDGGGEPRSAWHPSIHMPRAASRILLEITGVRVERLKDILEADARAEGVTIEDRHMGGYCAGEFLPPSIRAYRDLWESINGAGSWDANPWVWVLEFKRVTP